ncbi:hypothetical protein MAPG_05304 [Magnaporthiopsis poae ATCC 64411]|uniref:Uncharacterized protein n=1 Tax=Magnaporthiopsis poae (strain ATCC 64411 / 73-15) TaxID=644358 RepID=A0A0C4DZ16_MAGP6|nr:hypothetical protein MAPG_05304 [Magnaporthiopsis poae ATCC 64411]
MHFSLPILAAAQAAPCLAAVMSPAESALLPEDAPVWYPVVKRATASGLVPTKAISLTYASARAPSEDHATLSGHMKLPSVVLEGFISSVKCGGSGVTVPFTKAADFADAKTWPTRDLVLIITDQGGCAGAGERGVWVVSAAKFDDDAKTGVFTAEKTTLAEQMSDAAITWTTGGSKRRAKRGLDVRLNKDLSGGKISKGPVRLAADAAKFTGDVKVSGGLSFNFRTLELTGLTVDLAYDSAIDLRLTTVVTSKTGISRLELNPTTSVISPFTIPGVLDVGPMLQIAIGAEVAVKGSVKVKTNMHAEFKGATVHVDLLDIKKSAAKNWKPVVSAKNQASVKASFQVNPYVAATIGLSVKAFGGKIDLSGAVKAKAVMVNSFNAQADAAFTSELTKVKFAPPSNLGACPGGAWFGSTFITVITASAGGRASLGLLEHQLPVFEPACWTTPAPRTPRPAPAPGATGAARASASRPRSTPRTRLSSPR